ncbi:MAG: ABC transporter permease [Firmicutes bacterium]|nr:ABC transporter permease [Bacillota bacterium]
MIGDFLATIIKSATPILIAATGLVFSERAGVVNIGVEGVMLTGALVGVAGSHYLGSATWGALAAMVCGGLIGAVFAYFVVELGADQVVTGTAINILGLGLTTTLHRLLFGVGKAIPVIDTFESIRIPVLADIPVVGPALFDHMAPVYLAFLLVPVAHAMLFNTCSGLAVRSVGEHPRAADTVGINVWRIRSLTVIGSCCLAGLAGSYLSLGILSFFTENMVAGRGFIAVAAVIFGRYSPVGALLAALLFGAGDALADRFQALGSAIPYQFMLMIPYVLTVAVLAGFVGKAVPPASSGLPYSKE